MQNIYIIGAQSTGKTTLFNALEIHLAKTATKSTGQRPVFIHEVARKVLNNEKRFQRKDIAASPDRVKQLQHYILAAQYYAETTICPADASTWYISDRSGLDPIVYAKHFVGEDAAAEMLASDIWRELEDRMKAGVVILCEAGCHWLEDDGVRMMPRDMEEWMRLDAGFRELLQRRGIPFSVMSKDMIDLQQRVEYLRRHIPPML